MGKLNKNDIKFIAEHCKNVYLKKHIGSLVGENITYFKDDNINGYTFSLAGVTYIIVAGTDEFSDWLANLKIPLVRADGENFWCRVHSGFYSSYKQVRDHITKATKDKSRVIIAGHSLGGAIATLASFELATANQDLELYCVTFGSPRVGNRNFAGKFNKRVKESYRLVYRDDAVTKLPNSLLLFKHVKTLYQSSKRRFLTYFGRPGDHDMENYIEGVQDDMFKL